MKHAAFSLETLWLIFTENFLPWSIISRCVMEITIFMAVDAVVKMFLKETRSVREKYKIWLYESLTLILVSGVIAVTYHRPYVLLSLTIGTIWYTVSWGRTQVYSGSVLPAMEFRSSNWDSGSVLSGSLQREAPEDSPSRLLARPGIRQQPEPIQLADSPEIKRSSRVTGRLSDSKIANPAVASLREVRLSRSFPQISTHQNGGAGGLKGKLWSCLGYSSVPTPPGLSNGGQNVCFINSVLQCLAHTPSFVAALEDQTQSLTAGQSEMAFVTSLCGLLQTLNVHPAERRSSSLVISTDAFRSTVNRLCPSLVANPFSEVQSQQDAAEFLTWLLSTLQAILNRIRTSAARSAALADMESTMLFVYGNLSASRIGQLKEHFRHEIESANGLDLDSYIDAVTSLADLEWLGHCRANSSAVDEIFAGQLVDFRRCLMCSRVSLTTEAFTVLPVPVTECQTIARDALSVHLQECFERFSAVEELDGRDSLTCTCTAIRGNRNVAEVMQRRSLRIKQRLDRSVSDSGLLKSAAERNGNTDSDSSSSSSSSGSFVPGRRKSLVRKLPQCLVIQLMRFQYDPISLATCKRHTPIYIPVTDFELRDVVFDFFIKHEAGVDTNTNHTYALCGVCLHLGGQGASCRHYISYCLALDDKWYKFDDDVVTLVTDMDRESNTELFQENAYLLFYKRQQ